MRKTVSGHIWFYLLISSGLVLFAVYLGVQFGLLPLMILRGRRSIESAYSYLHSVNISDIFFDFEDGEINSALAAGLDHYVCMDSGFHAIASDEPSALAQTKANEFAMQKDLFREDASAVVENGSQGEQLILRGIMRSGSGETFYIAIYRRISALRKNISFSAKVTGWVLFFIWLILIPVYYFILRRGMGKFHSLVCEIDALYNKEYTVRIEEKIPVETLQDAAEKLNEIAERMYRHKNELGNFRYIMDAQKNDVKSMETLRKEMTANITHQLKTPLAIISSQLELEMEETDPEKKEYYYHSIMEEIDKLSTMVREILRNAKEEKGDFKSRPHSFNASDLLNEMSVKYENWLRSRNIRFEKSIEENVSLFADPVQVERVVNNYMLNACRYTKSGKTIRLSLKSSSDSCRIGVHNEGDGVPDAIRDQIWEGFFQGNELSGDSNAGLGLYIVKNIMEEHGGEYGFVNDDTGVEFYVIFKMKLTKADSVV